MARRDNYGRSGGFPEAPFMGIAQQIEDVDFFGEPVPDAGVYLGARPFAQIYVGARPLQQVFLGTRQP
jgi:hypothetical protein